MNTEHNDNGQFMPLWAKVLTVICMLPVLALPWLWGGNPDGDTARLLLRLYPVAVLLYGVCAWLTWRRGSGLTYILLVLLVLTHAAMWLLCYPVSQ